MDIKMQVTQEALTASHALAHRAGHEWGGIPLDAVLRLVNEGGFPALVAHLTEHGNEWRGIPHPDMGPGGVLKHVSAGRRVQWVVYPSGEATVTVDRPQGPAYVARRSPSGEWDVTRSSAQPGCRHLAALLRLLEGESVRWADPRDRAIAAVLPSLEVAAWADLDAALLAT